MISDLITLPVTGPFRFAMWVIRTVAGQAEAELYDEGKIRKELAGLELRYDMGELSEADYEQLEEALMERLRESRKRAEALGR
jgi:hypothetical protein